AVALEANRQAADFREKERQAHVASFDFASAVASAETAIVDAQQAEQNAQDGVAKRE
ncbi:unnamed protein product, partial [Symbiodinium microadriaticum]